VNVYPASHFVTPADKLMAAVKAIGEEMEVPSRRAGSTGAHLEAARLRRAHDLRPRDDA